MGSGSLKLKTPKSSNAKSSVSNTKISKQTNSTQNEQHKPSQKTQAQLAFEAARLKKQQEKLPLLASKSHKEKVAEFNEYLGKLSEHHDIPKVGPG